MNLLKAVTTIGGFTLLSRVFGFLRDILIANALGAGAAADAFFVAFRLPNLFRRLFAEGAFAAAFVPLYSRTLEGEGGLEARVFADDAFSLLAAALLGVIIVFEIAMAWVVLAMAPGFAEVEGKLELATELSRIMFPYLFFISLVSLQSGVLNSAGRFAAAAAAPILLNLTLITALLAFGDKAETPGHALAWGVLAAGAVQFLWLTWRCWRAGAAVRLKIPRLTEKVRLLVRRVIPVVFGASVYQINLLIGTIVASFVADGAVSYLYYADRVTQLPLGVIGVAVGTALLPLLSRKLKAGDDAGAMEAQNRGLELSLLLTLPAAAAFIVIAGPVIDTLFRHGAFGFAAAEATAAALRAYAAGLPAYVMIRVLTPGFYAREDTATPVRIAVAAMVVNVVLNLTLIHPFGHVGVALAASISAWMNVAGLWWVLARRGQFSLDERMKDRLKRMAPAAAGMAGVLEICRQETLPLFTGPLLERIGGLSALIAAGVISYAVFALLLRAAGVRDLKAMLRTRD